MPKIIAYRAHGVDSERGWGQDYWHQDFNTLQEAEAFKTQINSRNTSLTAPDFYSQVNSIEKIELNLPD